MGAQMIKEITSKTNDLTNNNTTTTTILTQTIVHKDAKTIAAGMNPMDLKRGIDKTVTMVINNVKARSKKIKSSEEIAQINTISANGQQEISDIIAKTMDKVGKKNIITIEEARGIETELETIKNMQFDRGYLSAYFVTNTERSSTT